MLADIPHPVFNEFLQILFIRDSNAFHPEIKAALLFDSTLPLHRFGDADSVSIAGKESERMVLVLQVDMVISQQRIQGLILFLLSVASMCNLFSCLDRYLKDQGLA